jgi:hypothetical protein
MFCKENQQKQHTFVISPQIYFCGRRRNVPREVFDRESDSDEDEGYLGSDEDEEMGEQGGVPETMAPILFNQERPKEGGDQQWRKKVGRYEKCRMFYFSKRFPL